MSRRELIERLRNDDDLSARLEAADALERMERQPMATALDDGTRILLHAKVALPHGMVGETTVIGSWCPHAPGGWLYRGPLNIKKFTHWSHLP